MPVYVPLAVTNPVALPIVAMSVLLMLHTPPPVPSVSVVAVLAHKAVVPPIGDMLPATVTTTVLVQPETSV